MFVKLYTYLKNTDLHAISALEAMQHYMGYKDIRSLKRYVTWTFDLDCEDDEVSQYVKQIVTDTYYIVNPNKQLYYLNCLPHPTLSKDCTSVALEVKKNFQEGESDVSDKVFERTGCRLHALKQSLVWEIIVESKGRDQDTIKSYLSSSIGSTLSRNKGLLVNSFYETYLFLDESSLYQVV